MDGTREVAPAIIASTITPLVIFLPLVFVRGVSGILFKELPYVIIFALICSLAVALSLVPMLASRRLTSHQQGLQASGSRTNRWVAAAGSTFSRFENACLDVLRWVLGHRMLTLAGAAGLLAASLLLLPLIVMFSVPLAAVGVLVTLFVTNTTLNVQSYIGWIMLGGIVVNNAILLVDQAGRLVQEGMRTREGLIEAGRRRLRPILMTTLTTIILGLMPLALGIGEGADAQAPLARAVVGGLTGSTLITLVLIPVVYSLFHPDPNGDSK